MGERFLPTPTPQMTARLLAPEELQAAGITLVSLQSVSGCPPTGGGPGTPSDGLDPPSSDERDTDPRRGEGASGKS